MRWSIPLALALLSGCLIPTPGEKCGDRACTALFAMVTVQIVDADGAPVNDLETTSIYLQTGEPLDVSSYPNDEGFYVIVDDNFLSRALDGQREHDIRFEARQGTVKLIADYVIEAGGCTCHVDKLAGPATMTMP